MILDRFEQLLMAFVVGFCVATTATIYVTTKYVTNKKDKEILKLTNDINNERLIYANNILIKERENAQKEARLNTEIKAITIEKNKILANIDNVKHDSNRLLNATCSSPTENGASNTASTDSNGTAGACVLDKSAESALFEYISKAEQLNEYSQACFLYAKEIHEQRERMIKEQQ